MRICVILEGCYPYVTGGVSSWMQQYIQAMPEHEFVVWAINADPSMTGNYRYTLPRNVVEVRELCLIDAFKEPMSRVRVHLSQAERDAMRELVRGGSPDWELVFSLFQKKRCTPVSFLMSRDFVSIMVELCHDEYPDTAFSDFFHTARSMLLPLFFVMSQPIPQADIYHAIATGYSGLLARMGAWKHTVPYEVTEHGIYTREREEEILRSKWVPAVFKKNWVRFFYMLSDAAYSYASKVTSLFERAMETQISMGCPREKCRVIMNGIHEERFAPLTPKEPNGYIDIGAVLRIAPIKDVLTLVYAFSELKTHVPNARLFIAGPEDDPEYAAECYALVEQLQVQDVSFLGTVNVLEWLGKFDFTILTSISEGQPLSVLESFAAGVPAVTTDVGCCKELINGIGPGDDLGTAGLCVPPMQSHSIAKAMEQLCLDEKERLRMGQAGRARVGCFFRHTDMIRDYQNVYNEVIKYGRNRV